MPVSLKTNMLNIKDGDSYDNVSALFLGDVQESVSEWLDNHPEAVVTVQDHSLTVNKLVVGTLGYLTPDMFGAVGDGVTDDTAALQDMFGNSDNCVIVFPSNKTYLISPDSNDDTKIIFPLTSPVTIYGNGSTLKIANGSGGYSSILGDKSSTAKDLTGTYITGLVFDHNSANCANFTTGNRFGANVLDSARMTFYTRNCKRFIFRNNTIRNSACTNCISINGATHTENILIDGNCFESIGKTPNRIYFDHSSLYLVGDNQTVVNNTFEGESWGCEGTTCAIEVHPGDGCVIANNIIKKFHTGINYACVHNTDSINGLVSSNSMEVLRHGIIIFGSTYSGHTSGYSVNGLTITGNIITIRNSIPKGYLALDTGTGGIIFNGALSLPAKDVYVSDSIITYDIESEARDYTQTYPSIGICEMTNTTLYENVVFENITIINPPGVSVTLGLGKGTIKNCHVKNIKVINPNSSYTKNNYALRRGVSLSAHQFIGDIYVDIVFTQADGAYMTRAFAFSSVADSTDANIVVRGSINWISDPQSASVEYKTITKYNDNTVPLVRIDMNRGTVVTMGDFAPYPASGAKVKANSIIESRSIGKIYYADEDTTTMTQLNITDPIDKVFANAFMRI